MMTTRLDAIEELSAFLPNILTASEGGARLFKAVDYAITVLKRQVPEHDPTVAMMMARALGRQAEAIAAMGDQILELSKK